MSQQDNPVLSLASAALVAYRKATGGADPTGEALNYVARMIAVRARVFVCAGDCTGQLKPLAPEEVFEGRFEDGGAQVVFGDGRASLTNLCMRFEDLPRVIDEITSLFKSGVTFGTPVPPGD